MGELSRGAADAWAPGAFDALVRLDHADEAVREAEAMLEGAQRDGNRLARHRREAGEAQRRLGGASRELKRLLEEGLAMSGRAIDVHLNDHLAGAMLGSDLAEQIRARHEGDPLGAVMTPLAREIDEDRGRLIDLMDRMDTARNPIKQATGWLAEKASRVKFSGIGSGEPDQSAFMALESLTLGVERKASLWRALLQIQSQYPALMTTDLPELIARADRQHELLERERLAAGTLALANR